MAEKVLLCHTPADSLSQFQCQSVVGLSFVAKHKLQPVFKTKSNLLRSRTKEPRKWRGQDKNERDFIFLICENFIRNTLHYYFVTNDHDLYEFCPLHKLPKFIFRSQSMLCMEVTLRRLQINRPATKRRRSQSSCSLFNCILFNQKYTCLESIFLILCSAFSPRLPRTNT